jgi:ankyrin repeat protein
MTMSRQILSLTDSPLWLRLFETDQMRRLGLAVVVASIFCFGAGPGSADPLHDAAREGDAAKVAALLKQGADVNSRDDSRETPLIDAALAGKTEVAAVLIEAKADIDARNDRGFSALHAAAYSGSVEIAELLLDHGAEVDALSMHKITPLHVAAE